MADPNQLAVSLLGDSSSSLQSRPSAEIKKSKVDWKTINYGMQFVLQSVSLAFISLFYSKLDRAAANAVINPWQSMTRNTGSGVLGIIGNQMGKKRGSENYHEAVSEIVYAGYAWVWLLTSISMIAFGVTPWVFPFMTETEQTAKTASNYFILSLIGNYHTFLITMLSPVFANRNQSHLPLLATVAFRGSVVGLSYYLAFSTELKERGIGIAAGVAPILPGLFMEMYARRYFANDMKYATVQDILALSHLLPRLFYCRLTGKESDDTRIQMLDRHLKINKGAKMGLQKFTEFFWFVVLPFMLQNDANLRASSPPSMAMNIFGMLCQGASTALGFQLSEKIALFEKASTLEAKTEALADMKKMIRNSLLKWGLVNSVVIYSAFYLSRNPLVNAYVPDVPAERALSLLTMTIMAGAFFFDAFRVVIGSLLTAWSVYTAQNMTSLFLMSGVGMLPVYFIVKAMGQTENQLPILVGVRAVTAMLCDVVNVGLLYRQLVQHEKDIAALRGPSFCTLAEDSINQAPTMEEKKSCLTSACSFVSKMGGGVRDAVARAGRTLCELKA